MFAGFGKKNGHIDAKSSCDAVAIVDEMLSGAIASGASDIHFEPARDKMVVRFRLDGVLNTIEELPGTISDNIISRLKVMASLLTYRNDIPQEGRLELTDTTGNVIDQRVSVFPTIFGQRAVIRLFYNDGSLEVLDKLGLPGHIETLLRKIALCNSGLLLLTGPAGSGKSTTLGAILRYILGEAPGKSIVALEDPVERHIDGITQVQIDPHGEMTFPIALRSLLRQDPEVLMLGEIRDAQTARIAIEASLTGHLLMSTMHSGSPSGALLRLMEMQIEPYQITSSILGVLNQRLLRRLCDKCKKPAGDTGVFEATGCDHCLGTGYHSRILTAEMVELDGQLRKGILEKVDLDELESILQRRGHMDRTQGVRGLVNNGIASSREATIVCGNQMG